MSNVEVVTMIDFTRGNCEPAIEQYKKAFGGEVHVLVRYSDAKEYTGKLTDKEYQLIYHAQMTFGKHRYLLCDDLSGDLPKGHPLYLVASFDNDEAVKKAFEIMSEGATIISPLEKTNFSSCCGTLIDRFGVKWDLMQFTYR